MDIQSYKTLDILCIPSFYFGFFNNYSLEVNEMNLLQTIKNNHLVELFINGNFGLEKEGLRAQDPADLASSMHPESLGNREVNPHIKTDYGESQPEIITPPLAPYSRAYNWLQTLSYVLIANLPEEEYMWPFSVPCKTPEDDEQINISKTTNPELAEYRKYTTAKYGKKRQLVNGIHINYSFDQEFLDELHANQKDFETIETMRDELYLKLASNFIRYQWLLVYLFGATPTAEKNFFDGPFFIGKELPSGPMRSLRNSKYGFTNDPKVSVRYDEIENYVNDLRDAVKTGKLQKEREYYGSIRLRGIVKDTSSLLENGIQYLEMRSFDNDPFDVSGLSETTIQFIHLFILTMLCLETKATADETELGNDMTKYVAEEDSLAKTIYTEEGYWLLGEMQKVVQYLELSGSYDELIELAATALEQPEKTIAGEITLMLRSGISLLNLGEELGKYHKRNILSMDHLPGFEHLELALQLQVINMLQMGHDIPLEYIDHIHQND